MARRVALVDRTGDLDVGIHVEARERLRSIDAAERHEVGDGRHARGGAHLDLVERLGADTSSRVGLQHHSVDLAEAVEVGHIHAAVVALQCREHARRAQTGTGSLGLVDVDHVLRVRGVEGRVGHLHLGMLHELGAELLLDLEQLVDVAARLVLQLDSETARCAVTCHHGRCEDHDCTILDGHTRLHVEGLDDLVAAALTLVPRLERDDARGLVVALAAQQRVALHRHAAVDLGQLAHNLVDSVGHGDGAVLAACRGQRHRYHDGTRVLIGHKTSRGSIHQEDEHGNHHSHNAQSQPLGANEELHATAIHAQQLVVVLVETVVEAAHQRGAARALGLAVLVELIVFFLVRLEEHCAQGRRQR